MSLKDFCLDRPLIVRLWSLLPSKCAFMKRGCKNDYLRWTEHELHAMAGPLKGSVLPICESCYQKLRYVSFKAGHSVKHLADGVTAYIPSESKGP